MKKEEMRHRIQEGFFELAPEDMFEKILEAVEEPVENKNVVVDLSDTKKSKAGKPSYVFRMMSKVAILVLVIGLGLGIFGIKRNNAAYILAIDVNPSIQMKIDRDYHVQKITGLNEDGKNIINKLSSAKNSSIEETVEIITTQLVTEGYLKENSGILFTLIQKDDTQDYEELKHILNQEIEKDVEKCGISGVKIAFQRTNSDTEETGKDILKKQMVEKYHLEDKKIDEMNIRDMIDYVENENIDKQILENKARAEKGKIAQQAELIPNETGTPAKSGKGETKEQDSTKAKMDSNAGEKKNNSATTAEDAKKKEETTSQKDGNNSQAQAASANNKSSQEKLAESGNTKSGEEISESESIKSEEKSQGKSQGKTSGSTDQKSTGKESQPEDKKNEGKPAESDDKGSQGKGPTSGSEGNSGSNQGLPGLGNGSDWGGVPGGVHGGVPGGNSGIRPGWGSGSNWGGTSGGNSATWPDWGSGNNLGGAPGGNPGKWQAPDNRH